MLQECVTQPHFYYMRNCNMFKVVLHIFATKTTYCKFTLFLRDPFFPDYFEAKCPYDNFKHCHLLLL